MKLLEFPQTIGEKIDRLLRPMIATTTNGRPDPHTGTRWKQILRDSLEQWRSAPELLEDDGIESPSNDLIDLSYLVADQLKNLGFEPPSVIVPTPDGGIVLRWRDESRTWSLEIDTDGSIEANLLTGGKLAWRHTLHQISADEA